MVQVPLRAVAEIPQGKAHGVVKVTGTLAAGSRESSCVSQAWSAVRIGHWGLGREWGGEV